MATRLQITCIKMTDRLGGADKVLRIGGATFNFEMHQAVVAALMGEFEFYVCERATGRELDVLVNEDKTGKQFLQARHDGQWVFALLDLPQCVQPGVVGTFSAIDVR
ncbi:MAG: hypothetical protein EOO28_30565 [Comamonadaceae bacterium]|nr:MAG: hypothetical protein EOO28_30565 [Comamonadaceae bacterium]